MNADAETRGRLALLWERATTGAPPDEWPHVVEVTEADPPDGFTLWRVARWSDDERTDPDPWLCVQMPRLTEDAPAWLRLRYLAQIIATATARCPFCKGHAGLSREPAGPAEQGRAVWDVLPLAVVVHHEPRCPAASWDESERRYFTPPTGTAEEAR